MIPSGSNGELRPITHEQWLRMIERYVTDEPEPPVRRGQRRYTVDGMVTLAVLSADGNGVHTAVRTAPLVQVSDEGIMIRSHAELAQDTVVAMQVYLEDDNFALLGRVMHCTDTIGGYKVGIQLAFVEQPAATQTT
jgi:hypothetical protein